MAAAEVCDDEIVADEYPFDYPKMERTEFIKMIPTYHRKPVYWHQIYNIYWNIRKPPRESAWYGRDADNKKIPVPESEWNKPFPFEELRRAMVSRFKFSGIEKFYGGISIDMWYFYDFGKRRGPETIGEFCDCVYKFINTKIGEFFTEAERRRVSNTYGKGIEGKYIDERMRKAKITEADYGKTILEKIVETQSHMWRDNSIYWDRLVVKTARYTDLRIVVKRDYMRHPAKLEDPAMRLQRSISWSVLSDVKHIGTFADWDKTIKAKYRHVEFLKFSPEVLEIPLRDARPGDRVAVAYDMDLTIPLQRPTLLGVFDTINYGIKLPYAVMEMSTEELDKYIADHPVLTPPKGSDTIKKHADHHHNAWNGSLERSAEGVWSCACDS